MAKFKTRARALDMLGRQQIASIPTAISELFKNAHDAYADNVEVDYIRKDKLLVLRDDGLGMTKKDFEEKWLVLGTESKFGDDNIERIPIDPDKPKRHLMGEKGIGRLSIAALGKQVLILTRAKRNNSLSPITAAFINWELFELPNLDLDEIRIPLREFKNMPTQSDIEEMKNELLKSFIDVSDKIFYSNRNFFENILYNIQNFNISPKELNNYIPGDFSLSEKSGTHFYISPVDEILSNDIDSGKSNTATNLEKFLIGFTNTMTPNHPPEIIKTSFRDYRSEDNTFVEIIDKDSFFTPDDFNSSDHHFIGSFDEFGQFSGKVNIYNKHEIDHKIIWDGNNYKETDCGPFSLEISYLQGDKKDSLLDPIKHDILRSKSDKFGGLYIYRHNIRILPYGDSDYDYLEIEKNRSKRISTYFFSYRRMFGIVNISKENNPKLIEKSGREGFIENKAYRQFRDILKNFFLQLAADFFRDDSISVYSEYWIKEKEERRKAFKLLEAREKQAKAKKDTFSKEIQRFFTDIKNDKFNTNVKNLLVKYENMFSSIYTISDSDIATQKMLAYENQARREIISLKDEIRVASPRGFTLSKENKNDWEIYLEEFKNIEINLFPKAEKEIIILIEKYRKQFNLELSKRKRIENAVEIISKDAQNIAKKKKNEVNQLTEDISKKVRKLTRNLIENLENKIKDSKFNLSKIKTENDSDENIYEELKLIENPIIQEKEYADSVFEKVIKNLYYINDSLNNSQNENGEIITDSDIRESLEDEIEELKEKLTSDVELIQLGLAVNIIHHEFNSSVSALRSNLNELRRFSDINSKLETVYKTIRSNFEHLDSYLSILTPFSRRLYRKEELIEAEDIYIFLLDVFKGRLDRHKIEIKRTNLFLKTSFRGLRSIFYPVFVNVVDNAIHWLKQKKDTEEKVIRLHADNEGNFYISNNGVEIPFNDKERIFDIGFTRKSNGRGMGLAISRQVLESIDYEIFVDSPRKGATVTFKIQKKV